MGLRYRFYSENLTISKHTLNEPQHDGRVRVGRCGDTIARGMNHSAYAHLVGRQQSRSQPCSNRATNSLVRVRKSGIRESNSRRTRRAQKQRKGSPSPGIRVRTQEREGWGSCLVNSQNIAVLKMGLPIGVQNGQYMAHVGKWGQSIINFAFVYVCITRIELWAST